MEEKEINVFIAGFFEGDGCISIFEALSHGRGPYTSIHLIITNSSLPLLELCRDALGGHIYKNIRVGSPIRMGPIKISDYTCKKDIYQLRIASKSEVRNAIKKILPYLISKKEQAEHALKLLG